LTDTLVVPLLPAPTVPVVGGGLFPVHRIYCVGRNYAAHAREMGFDPDREEPFFFIKPADTIVANGATIPYPSMTSNYHHEIELVVAIGNGGSDIAVEEAPNHVFGYAVGLDMTRRDLQMQAREKGRPWDMGKGFDQSAPCAAITPVADAGRIDKASIALSVNGETRQSSTIAYLIWSIAETIHWLSKFVTLAPGDLIYTGTPEGVNSVVSGDVLEGRIDGLSPLSLTIA
jgi:fumarylpyruvate hydrolase